MIFAADTESVKGVNDYWEYHMPICAMEECAELIKEISKIERARDHSLNVYYGNLRREMADVIISIAALCERYGIDPNHVNEAIDEKLSRKYEMIKHYSEEVKKKEV